MANKAAQFLKLMDKHKRLVKGECFDLKHLNEIEITGWNWDVADPTVPKKGPKGGGVKDAKAKVDDDGPSDRKPKPSKFSFTKTTDSSSIRLLQAMSQGEIFPEATFAIVEEFEAVERPFELYVHLTDAFLVEFSWRANAESAGLTLEEGWDLNYSRIEFEHKLPGGNRGGVHEAFDRPPDSTDGKSDKSPLSDSEVKAKKKAELDELLKDLEKRTGKK